MDYSQPNPLDSISLDDYQTPLDSIDLNDPFNESARKPTGTLDAYGQTITQAVKQVPGYIAASLEGSTPYDSNNLLDSVQATAKKDQEAFANGKDAQDPSFGGLATVQDIKQTAPSLAGSITGMVPTLAGAFTGARVGALAGSIGGIPGAVIGGTAGGIVGAGLGLFGMMRSAENQFVKENIDKENSNRAAQGQAPLTQQESVQFQNDLNATGDTRKMGMAEAFPETVGNLLETAVLATPIGKFGKSLSTLGHPLAKALTAGLMKGAATVATEAGEEEITRQLQNPIMQRHGFPEQTAGETLKQTAIATAPFAALGFGTGAYQSTKKPAEKVDPNNQQQTDINPDNNLDLRTDEQKAQDNASVINTDPVINQDQAIQTGLQGTPNSADAAYSPQTENLNGSQESTSETQNANAQEEGLLGTVASEQLGATSLIDNVQNDPLVSVIDRNTGTAFHVLQSDLESDKDRLTKHSVTTGKRLLTPILRQDIVDEQTYQQELADQQQRQDEQANQQTETQAQDQTSADQSTAVTFQPTHELNDGTQVQQIGDNTYVDQAGDEWGADDAKPIGKVDTATTDTSTEGQGSDTGSNLPSYATAPRPEPISKKAFNKLSEEEQNKHLGNRYNEGYGGQFTIGDKVISEEHGPGVIKTGGGRSKWVVNFDSGVEANVPDNTLDIKEVQNSYATAPLLNKRTNQPFKTRKMADVAIASSSNPTVNQQDHIAVPVDGGFGIVPKPNTTQGNNDTATENVAPAQEFGNLSNNDSAPMLPDMGATSEQHDEYDRQYREYYDPGKFSDGKNERSQIDLSNKSDAFQALIDKKHDELDAQGISWDDQKKDAELHKLYSQRVRIDKEAMHNAYKGIRRVILGAVRNHTIDYRDSDLPPGWNSKVTEGRTEQDWIDYLIENEYHFLHTLGAYSAKELTDSLGQKKTIEGVAERIAKQTMAKDNPIADYDMSMNSNMSGLSWQQKDKIKNDATKIAEEIDQGINDYLAGSSNNTSKTNQKSIAQETAKKPDWEMTRDEYKNSFDPRDYKDSNYDRMIHGAVFNEKITQAEADKKLIRDYSGNKYHWAKTRKELEQEKKEAVKNAKAARAEGNKNPIHSVKWAQKSDSNTAKNNITSTNLHHNKLLEVHQERVQEALSEGKSVPQEVLADYPDLQAPVQETANPIHDTADVSKKGENVDTYHPAIKSLASDLTVGGGVSIITNQNDVITGKTPSLNPEWFKDGAFITLDDNGNQTKDKSSVKDIQTAVDDHYAGKRLTPKQKRILSSLSNVAHELEQAGNDNHPNDFNYETSLIANDLELQLNKGNISIDDIQNALDEFDDSIPFDVKGDDLSIQQLDDFFGITNEEREPKASADILTEETLTGYTEAELATREREQAQREKQATDQAITDKQSPEYLKAEADFNEALSDVGIALSDKTSFNAVPSEVDLQKAVKRLVVAAFKLGYIKLSDNVNHVIAQLKVKFGKAAAHIDEQYISKIFNEVKGDLEGKNAVTGDLNRVNKDVRNAVDEFLSRRSAEEQTRIKDNLVAHSGTAWAAAAVKGMAYREMLHRAMEGRSIDNLTTNDIWGDQNMANTKIIKAFKQYTKFGDKAVHSLINQYDFIGGNRKAENDVSTSFANCNPSDECATHCYAAGSNARPNEIAKSEFTEFVLENYLKQATERIANVYKFKEAGLAGLSLRLNDKGDLSEAQLKLISGLNDKSIVLQIFSKRPDLLRKIPDSNLKMLSIDSSNMDIALANPDLRLAVVITDGMTEAMLEPLHDRVSVYLPVNLKGKSVSTEELKSRFPNLYPKMKRDNLCPVDGGNMATLPGTSFVDIQNGINKGAKEKVWTCTACDLYGAAGCFKGDRQTTQRNAATQEQVINFSDVKKELAIKNARIELQKQLDLLQSLGDINGKQHEEISGIISTGQPDIRLDANSGTETGSGKREGSTISGYEESRGRTGRDDSGRGETGRTSGESKEVKFSKSTAPVVNPHSKTSLNQAVTKAMDTLFGQGWTNRLMATGKFKMISAAEATGLIGKNAMFHKVWHGSPHDHNGFDSSKIGTGEGNQSFGYGHYFSDERSIAESYRKNLSSVTANIGLFGKPKVISRKDFKTVDSYFVLNGSVSIDSEIRNLESTINAMESSKEIQDIYGGIHLENAKHDLALYKKIQRSGGINIKSKLYEVDLAPSQDEYLDWNKPLSEQSDVVQAGLKKLYKHLEGDQLNEYLDIINADWNELTGHELYKRILQQSHQDGLFIHPDIYDRSVPDDEASSHLLYSLGIRGIRYKAAGGKSDASNYVIFNDADIKIEVKYSKNGDVIAFYNPADDTTYLVHDNITQNTSDKALQGLMLHEIGVHALTLGQSNEAFKDILRRFEALKKTNPKVQAAFDRVPKDTKEEDIVEEALAYYLEENPRSSLAQRIVEWFRQAVRALGKTLPVLERAKFSQWANKLTEAELIGMATSALKSAPDSLQFDNVGRNREGIKLSGDNKKRLAPNGTETEGLVLFHGGDNYINKLDRSGVYRGVFASADPEVSLSHGEKLTRFEVTGKIKKGWLDADVGYEKTKTTLKSVLKEQPYAKNYLKFDDIYNIVIYEDEEIIGEKDLYDNYDLMFELQALRADVAYKLGYDAVSMKDEHGISYVILNASKVEPSSTERSEIKWDITQSNDNGDNKKLLAPNGKPSNLNAMQWAQVRTPEFLNWFGDWINDPENASKVVDENGEPLVVYHGTDKSFDSFDIEATAQNRTGNPTGIYLTPSKDEAKYFGSNVFNLFAIAVNPYIEGESKVNQKMANTYAQILKDNYPNYGDDWIDNTIIPEFKKTGRFKDIQGAFKTRVMKAGGFDSWKDGRHIDVFGPNQIKSATENNGDFSQSNNNIKFSRSTPSNTPADNSAIRDMFKKVKDNPSLEWLGQLFTRNQLIEFIASKVPKMMDYKKLSQKKDNALHEREQKIAEQYEAMNDLIRSAATDSKKLPGFRTDYAKARRLMNELSRAQSLATNLDTDFDPADHVDKDFMTKEEREAFDAYDVLPDELKSVYKTMRKDYRDDMDETRKALLANLDRFPIDSKAKAAIVAEINAHFDQALSKGVYFPLARFGNIIVTGTNPQGEFVSAFVKGNTARDKMITDMEAQGYTKVHSQEKEEYDADLIKGNVAHTMAALAKNTVDDIRAKMQQGQAVEDDIDQMLADFHQELIRALPDTAYRKHFLHRKGTLGESGDTLRAYANTRTSSAKNQFALIYDYQIAKVLTDSKQEIAKLRSTSMQSTDFLDSVMKEIGKREQALKANDIAAWAQLATSLGFMGALGYNIASAGVNMLQVVGIGLPELSGRHGFGKSSAAITHAYQLILNRAVLNKHSGFDLMKNPAIKQLTKAALQHLHDIGKIDLTMTHDSIAASKNPSYSSNQVNRAVGVLAKKSGYLFHVAEALNRQVMGIAAFELELAKNGGDYQAALIYAEDVIDNTQYDYGPGNRARFMMGDTARVITLFKAYAIQTSWFIGRNAYQWFKGLKPEERLAARKTLLITMAMSFATAGLFGMPIGTEAFAGVGGVAGFKYKGAKGAIAGAAGGVGASMLASAAIQALLVGLGADDDDDIETQFRNWLTDNLNQSWAEFVTKGPARFLVPGDIAGRTGLSHLWYQPQNKELEGRDKFNQVANTLMGPVASQAANLVAAQTLWADGEQGRAIEMMSPRALANMLAAYRMAEKGVTTLKGDKIIQRDLTDLELLSKAIGFNPSVITNAYDANSAIAKESTKHTLAKSHLVNRWLSGDATERSDLMKGDIKDFNESVPPSERITLKSLFKSMRSRKGIDKHTKNGLYLSKKQNYLRDIGRFNRQE